ncbi:MAG: glycosyltransferase [Candidatus Dormibacteraceae bacterium]
MAPIKLACDLSRLNKTTPDGIVIYANFILNLLRSSGEIELVKESESAVILSLDGRFRPGRGQLTVSAIHDLGHLLYRRAYSLPRWIQQSWRVASAAHRSHHLLAPSAAISDGLQRWLRVPAQRITQLEPLPQPHFQRSSVAEIEAFQGSLGLPPRYFLFLGHRSRRKNLNLLARAWQLAKPQLGSEVGLVVAGNGSISVPTAHNLDYLPPSSLPPLLSGALAWLCPSFYEGSAVGAMEAMACGAPPLVAPAGALARAVEGAGLILDPEQPEQWAQAMVDIASNNRLRASLSAAGRRAIGKRRSHPPEVESLLAVFREAVS